jgi:flagellin
VATINTNMASLNAQRNLAASQGSLMTSMQRLSSGLRVNSARDDAAGLAIAERMNTQVRGMNVAMRNANDAISLTQTAESSLGKVGDMLQRMRELAVQAANATNNSGDVANLNEEFTQLGSEISRTINSTTFNGNNILSSSATMSFQVGAGSSGAIDRVDVAISNVSTGAVASLGTATLEGSTALTRISDIDNALTIVNTERAKLGAVQNRFEAVISTLRVASENTAAARGRIVDADFAQETANLSRAQILQQAGTAMVAQANQIPQQVLQLLR